MQLCFGCRSIVPQRPDAPMCSTCQRLSSRRLVTLNRALAMGYSLAALRFIGASMTTASTTTYFLESRILAAAARDPCLFDPEASRRDAGRLRRDRRAARAAHDATRRALMHDASLRRWREGAHVAAVARGLLTQRQAVGLARAARAAWAFVTRPEVRSTISCATQEVSDALDACVIARHCLVHYKRLSRGSHSDRAPAGVGLCLSFQLHLVNKVELHMYSR